MHLGNTECIKGEKFVDGITNGAAWYAGSICLKYNHYFLFYSKLEFFIIFS
jgi:hypothetical protein